MVREYVPAAELKRALVDAGLQLLFERGVTPGFDRVTLKDVIERAGVPRSSVYLLLGKDGTPLKQLHHEILLHLDRDPDITSTMQTVARTLDSQAAHIESGDPVELANALREVIRLGVESSVEETFVRMEWRIYVASLATIGLGAPAHPDVLAMHHRATEKYKAAFVPLFNDLMVVFGLQLREPMTTDQLAATSTAMSAGVALRLEVDPALSDIERNTGPGGKLQRWNAAAVAFEGFCLTWLEPDPNAPASADLSSWTDFK